MKIAFEMSKRALRPFTWGNNLFRFTSVPGILHVRTLTLLHFVALLLSLLPLPNESLEQAKLLLHFMTCRGFQNGSYFCLDHSET